jgi:hypothetical protein
VQQAARRELAPAGPERKPVKEKKLPPPRPFALVLVEVERVLEPLAE